VRQLSNSALHRRVVDVKGASIDGSVVRFPGLEATVTDVFIRISRLDGNETSMVVGPTQPYAELRGERPWYLSAGEYLVLGFHHILMGIDHLLFVLGFGLLHGFGFASGLSTVGMPKAEIPIALLMFNVGVELGQIVFVALILLIHRSLKVLAFRWPRWVEFVPGYAIGSLGAFWTIQRTVMMF
jgi:hypothetical protein